MITGGKAQDIETVLETLNEVLERVTVLIDAADTLVALTMDTNTTIGALLGSKLVYEKLNTQLDRLDYFSYEGIRLLDVLSGEVPRILYRTDSLTQKLFSMTNEMENVPQKIDNAFLSLDRFFGQMNGAMDSLNRMVGGVNGLVSQGEETLLNADNLIEGASNMWIIRRSLPKRDSVPFVAEDVW